MKASPMSEEFHDWLDKCPVMWLRDRVDRDHVFYAFETPEEVEPDDLLSERHAGQFIMAGIITYPWARPHGYNLELKKKKTNKQQAGALKQTQLKSRIKT